MAPRAYWKGYLKLSLVSCPIAVNPATSSSERVSFRQINKKTGNRLRQQLVDDETREAVDAGDKGKGYEVGQERIHPHRRRGARSDSRSRASTPSRSTASCRPRRSTSGIYDSPYYIIAQRQGRAGGLRGHPRRHEGQGHGGARPRRAEQARARALRSSRTARA